MVSIASQTHNSCILERISIPFFPIHFGFLHLSPTSSPEIDRLIDEVALFKDGGKRDYKARWIRQSISGKLCIMWIFLLFLPAAICLISIPLIPTRFFWFCEFVNTVICTKSFSLQEFIGFMFAGWKIISWFGSLVSVDLGMLSLLAFLNWFKTFQGFWSF